jgi:phospho-N-acetylmuramoyl-pentapeptide-transferase
MIEEAFFYTSLLRIFLLSSVSFLVTFLAVPFWTNFLYRYEFWKKAKEETIYGTKATVFQSLHAEKHKRHIPTMAGILFWVTVALVTVIFNLTRSQTWLPVFTLVTIGILGAVDDWFNIRGIGGVKGIRARHKMFWLLGIAAVGAWWFYYKLGFSMLHIPTFGSITLGWWYVPVFIFLFSAVTNAVNITDGLDGLSAGILAIAFGSYGILALANAQISLAIFCATVIGVLLAYLWFNIHPARFFGGDTYSLAFGATLAVVAMLIPNGVGIAVLPIILLIPLVETLSVILQLTYRKFTGKKLFRIAPLHHHFEAIGWPETKVTMRFWVVSLVASMLGIIIGLLGRG